MSNTTERALRKAMREKTLERVYYFVGEDDFLKESMARELVDAVLDRQLRDFNLQSLRGAESGAEALEVALNTPPMLSSRRMVVVRDVGALKKAAREPLLRYLTHAAADTVLLLVALAGDKPDRAIAERSTVVEFTPLSADRIPRWIAHHASTSLGVAISPEAATLLQDAVGGDLATLASELDKLASYSGGGAIDESAVSTVVGVKHAESLGALLDAVAKRDASTARSLAERVLLQPQTTLVSVIMALGAQMLAVAWGAAARSRGMPPGALEREYFALLRDSKVYPGRSWGEAIASWVRAIPQWSSAQADHAIRLLLAADGTAKDTRLSSDDQVLTSLVMSLCAIGADRQ